VLAKARVLDRQQRILQQLGRLRQGQVLPALGAELCDLHAVGCQHAQRQLRAVVDDGVDRRQPRRHGRWRGPEARSGDEARLAKPAQGWVDHAHALSPGVSVLHQLRTTVIMVSVPERRTGLHDPRHRGRRRGAALGYDAPCSDSS